MSSYLIKNALVPVAGSLRIFEQRDIRLKNGLIDKISDCIEAEPDDNEICAKDCVIYPGFINTHHHLAQSVLKGVPEGLNQGLADWLGSVPYRFWPHISPALMYGAAKLGLAEQLRSGVTTCADHHYLYHATSTPELEDALWQAATDLGIRLILCRGGSTNRGSHKGLANAGITVESIDQVIKGLERSLDRYHQCESDAMRRIVVGPTSLIHSTEPEHLKVLALFARDHQLKMHSHLLEVQFDETQAQEKYGKSAVEFAADCEWLGPDVWFAHLVQANPNDIQLLAQSNTAIAHCPTSNCRLGSGIAPIVEMANAGMNITLGVDGSASSESGSMIQELNLAWLLHRTQHGSEATSLNDVLRWATSNGAKLLGLDTTGEIAVGRAADLVIYDLSHFRYWGVHSPEWAPILAGEPINIKASFVAGKKVVQDGQVLGVDFAALKALVTRELTELLKRA